MALRFLLLAAAASAALDSASFKAAVRDLVEGPCAGATECDDPAFDPGHECREGAQALADAWDAETRGYLVEEAEDFRGDADTVAAVLTCPERRAADEDAAAGQAAAGAEVTTQAGTFGGDCSGFYEHALEVVDSCQETTCCADVASDTHCRASASGLQALYPQNAINYCLWKLRLRSCFVRQVTACALQAEIHEILYSMPWQPTCTRFPAMAYQQDLAEVDAALRAKVAEAPEDEEPVVETEGDEDARKKKYKLGCVILLALGVMTLIAIAATAYSCFLRKKVRVLAVEQHAPTARVEVKPMQQAKVLDDKAEVLDVEAAALHVEAPPASALPAAEKLVVEEATVVAD